MSVRLFEQPPVRRSCELPAEANLVAGRAPDPSRLRADFVPDIDERVLDVFARARNPDDPFELRDLWLGRVEHELGPNGHRADLAGRWRTARVRRQVERGEVMSNPATVRLVKELFNWFFRDDVYGDLRTQANLILSGGAVDEQLWGLPGTLKQCLHFALDRDWYGYSDSRGRVPARAAVAAYENVRIDGAPYDVGNVALTLGGTFAISSLADFILTGAPATESPVLCGIPNYPPLVESIARRRATRLVDLPSRAGATVVDGLIAELSPTTPLVMLQTASNPTGASVPEPDLERLIRAASPTTMIVLDECHEWLGPPPRRSRLRAAANVIRVTSLSKMWSTPGLKVGWILADARFIDAYYEHASTTFGGPPSFFYTMIETLARMERWLSCGIEVPGSAELAEFEQAYGLDLARLQGAYSAYRFDRQSRERELSVIRDAAVVLLTDAGVRVIPPRYSINLAVEFPGWNDSYLCFREVLRRTGVSVFPGVLTFCLSGGVVRITTARRWADLSRAASLLRAAVCEPVAGHA